MAQRTRAIGDEGRPRLLAAVGLSDEEESAYTVLIDHPGVTLSEIAELLHVSRNRARTVMNALARNGLVSRTPDKTPRYLPVPPDIAVEALIADRERELERARQEAGRLSRQAAESRPEHQAEFTEIIMGSDAAAAHINQLQQDAHTEVITLARTQLPHNWIGNESTVLPALERGVRFHVVYDRAALAEPGGFEPVGRAIAAGAQARVYTPIPATIVIVDRSVGLIPFDLSDPGAAWLVLRRSPALDVFIAYFDIIWERASRLRVTRGGEPKIETVPRTDSEHHQLLIDFLAAGLRDDVISGHLGISPRTLDRRVRDLMDALGATTRFQAGWLAAHQALQHNSRRRRKTS